MIELLVQLIPSNNSLQTVDNLFVTIEEEVKHL